MALKSTQIREEIKRLRQEKAEIEERIEGLQRYLHAPKSAEGRMATGVSARGGIDIRPTVKTIFEENGNTPLKVKEIVDAVAKRHADVERRIIEKKMFHVKRTILEKGTEYGSYRLKPLTG